MSIDEIYVKDVMSTSPVVAYEDEMLSTVLSRMKEKEIHEVPVVDHKNKLLGYFDFENLMRRKNVPMTSKISTLMIKPPRVDENTKLLDAVKTMVQSGLRSIPVVDNNDFLKGLVSRTDVTKALLNVPQYSGIPIEEIMIRDPVTVNINDDINVAIQKMRNLGELTIPVVDEHNHLVGMVHIRDLTNAVWRVKERPTIGEIKGQKEKKVLFVKEFLNPPVFVRKDAKLKDVIDTMLKMKSYICAIVDEDNRIVGIITQKDIVELIARKEESEGVFVQITGLESDDPSVFDTIYQIIEKSLKKIAKFENYTPQSLNIHVEEHNVGGNEINYAIRARLVTEKKVFYIQENGWNLYRVVDDAMSGLERMIRKEKEREKELRRYMP